MTHHAHNSSTWALFPCIRDGARAFLRNAREVEVGTPMGSDPMETHTYVPGPDGKFGYGGECFPKDVNAFTILTQGTPLGSLLTPLHALNVHFRGKEERI